MMMSAAKKKRRPLSMIGLVSKKFEFSSLLAARPELLRLGKESRFLRFGLGFEKSGIMKIIQVYAVHMH